MMLYADMKRLDRDFDAVADQRLPTRREFSVYRKGCYAYYAATPPTRREATWRLIIAAKVLRATGRDDLVAGLTIAAMALRNGTFSAASLRRLRQMTAEADCIAECDAAALMQSALRFLGRPRLAVRND